MKQVLGNIFEAAKTNPQYQQQGSPPKMTFEEINNKVRNADNATLQKLKHMFDKAQLTPHETQVYYAYMAGMSLGQVAEEMKLAEDVVKYLGVTADEKIRRTFG